MDERYLATLEGDDAATWGVLLEVTAALNDRELDGLARLLTPEVVMVDHRLASFGAADREAWLSVFATAFAGEPSSWMPRKVVGLERGIVTCGSRSVGRWTARTGSCPLMIVSAVRDGHLASVDLYEVEDVACGRRTVRRARRRPSPGNLAVRAFDRSIELNIAGRVDELVDLYAVDVIAARPPTADRWPPASRVGTR